ncbi:MAG: cation-translocating P-type ATPase [Candidatus Bathyarchaeia archaeon]|jgi:Cd2+/Zn2+-exporting ATPase
MSSPEKPELEEPGQRENRRVWILLALAFGLTMVISGSLDLLLKGVPLGFVIPLLNEPASLSRSIYYVSVIAGGVYVGVLGLKELILEKRFSVEFLMSIAALGAVYLGFLFEATTVLFLYSLAEYFEEYIQDRATRTVEELSRFMPDKASVIVDGSERTIDVRAVRPGMTMMVRPGERIAMDGTVVEGCSSVDQSLVTGESIPVLKKTGDCVYAGTVNSGGILKVAINKGAEDTLVSRIVKLVIESKKRKAHIEKLVDRFARFYVPVVIGLAAFTALGIPRLTGGAFTTWLYRSLILLVVSCPSAFVISVPATIFAAVTIAARKGVLVKGGICIEKLARVRATVFDKTGTLTLGTPVVNDVDSVEKSDQQALKYAAALEQFSNHPLAQTIVKKAKERNLDYGDLKVEDVEEVPGKGMAGYVEGVHVVVGNMELMKQHDCNCEQISENYESEKHTAVCVSMDKTAVASFCVMDEVRGDAAEAVKALKKSGIHTVMLTGDKREIADEVGRRLEIDEVHSELFPEDKLRILSQIKAKYGTVAMVGDGVNDAPALAASDVGIAMGGSRVDVALESADIVLVKNELSQIPYLIRLSGETVRIAKQNIMASLAVKIVLGALGLFGFVPLWFTVASGDDGVTMLLLLNTLRLAQVKI